MVGPEVPVNRRVLCGVAVSCCLITLHGLSRSLTASSRTLSSQRVPFDVVALRTETYMTASASQNTGSVTLLVDG